MTCLDESSIPKYEGSQRFKDLEDWLALLVIQFECIQYGSFDRDHKHVLFVADYLKDRALSWYTDHIIIVTDDAMLWTFEEVVIRLYDQFVHPSAMEDAHQDLEQVEYMPEKEVQGVYDEMLMHACNMSETPDNHTLVKLFLTVLLLDWRKQLFDQRLSLVINSIHEFVGAAKALEITDQTAQLFEQYAGQHIVKKLSVLRTAQRDSSTPQYKWRATTLKLLIMKQWLQQKSRKDQPKADDNRRRQQAPERTHNTRDKPENRKGRNVVGASVCFNCNQPGHYAQQCLRPCKRPDHLRAAHTELPNGSGDEED